MEAGELFFLVTISCTTLKNKIATQYNVFLQVKAIPYMLLKVSLGILYFYYVALFLKATCTHA